MSIEDALNLAGIAHIWKVGKITPAAADEDVVLRSCNALLHYKGGIGLVAYKYLPSKTRASDNVYARFYHLMTNAHIADTIASFPTIFALGHLLACAAPWQDLHEGLSSADVERIAPGLNDVLFMLQDEDFAFAVAGTNASKELFEHAQAAHALGAYTAGNA